MNKSKKIAVAAVSMVLAGTIAGSLAACGKKDSGEFTQRSTEVPFTRFNATSDQISQVTVGGLQLSVRKDNNKKVAYPQGTNLNVNIIDSNNKDRQISYDSGQIATLWNAVDNYTYVVGSLKPAWWQLGQDLGIKFTDVAQPDRSGKELTEAVANGELAKYNLINSSVTAINTNKDQLLNLADFLEYMPNFKNFLDEYEIVKWSLQMDENGGMYYIPYFDGNDDIEKYEMVQRDWVKVILDGTLDANKAISYLDQYKAKVEGASSATSIPADSLAEAWMGTTAEDDWEVDTTNPADTTKTVKLKVSYGDVITALKDTNSALYKAIVAAGDTAPQTASGNIVDIQNAIITKTNGAVKGDKLATVLREYIKVAYKLDGKAYTTLSDVFLSESAGWDADLMVAMFRCVVTNFKSFNGLADAATSEVYALAGRQATPQRENDIISLAGELYGVRGMDSRLDYLYVDSQGTLQDARLEEASYEAAARFNKLAKEGLLYNKVNTQAKDVTKVYSPGSPISFMLHDYVQTQTKDGFTSDTFDFAPILTPVAHWDVDGDGVAETTMRFTESWRSVKNSGVAIPKASVSDPNTLAAVISFVDYLFSNDGQIIGSYGPMSTKGNTADADGYWYGNNGVAVLDAEGKVKAEYANMVETVDGAQYFLKKDQRSKGFMYNNVLYTGMAYKDKQIPIMTDNNKNFYLGEEVNGVKMSTDNTIGYKKNHVGNYTDYARGVVGAALPIGNKDQGFEYQCTADCGLNGAAIVNTAILNGSVKHLTQEVDSNNWWYTVVPTVLPLQSIQSTAIGAQSYFEGDSTTASYFNATSGKTVSNVYIDLAFWGYGTYKIGTCHNTTGAYDMKSSAAELVATIKTYSNNALQNRINWYNTAWTTLKTKNA